MQCKQCLCLGMYEPTSKVPQIKANLGHFSWAMGTQKLSQTLSHWQDGFG